MNICACRSMLCQRTYGYELRRWKWNSAFVFGNICALQGIGKACLKQWYNGQEVKEVL